MRRYSTIVADPPWRQSNGPPLGGVKEGWAFPDHADRRSQPLPYATMSVAEIAALPVSAMAEADAHLWLWTTNAYVGQSFDVVRAWGFRFSTLLTWCKTTMGGGLGGDAFGISSEYLLFCRRGKLPAASRVSRTWFEWPRRYDERGKPMSGGKPKQSLDLIEQVSPGPYCELFSREQNPRAGWDYWGDESLGTAQMPCARCGGLERVPTVHGDPGFDGSEEPVRQKSCPECSVEAAA